MIIERTKKEVIFRFPSNLNIDYLQDMADLLEFNELSTKASVSQTEVDKLVKGIKKGRWANTKAKISE